MTENNDKAYLQDLLLNIKAAYANQEVLSFKIIGPKEKGFQVKVGGLFAYVSFNHFCWAYPSIDFWRPVSHSLIGMYFRGKVHSIGENPISILLDAKEQKFETPNLENLTKYRGIALQKTKYGVFVDLGIHFNWKFGSILGLVHKTALIDESILNHWKLGEEMNIQFLGYNEKGQIILGDNRERGKWLVGEMDHLIGTVQNVRVVISEAGKFRFYVAGIHKAILPITEELYPNHSAAAKKYASSLSNGETIECEVVKMNKRKSCLILKLLIEPPVA